MSRRPGSMPVRIAVTLMMLVLGLRGASPAAASPSVALALGGASCPGADGLGTSIPVLLVHGFRDGPATWTAGGTRSMAAAIERVAQVKAVPALDYSSQNTSWVTNSAIGPALAQRITCLAAASARLGGPGKVIIVAHSMGGLAIRCAVDPACAAKAANPDQIALVITLDTPNLGSPLAGPVPQKAHFKETGVISTLMASACDSAAACRDFLLLGPATQASQAMASGSAQLRNLPALPASVPVFAMAGQITVTDTMFSVPLQTWDIGDGVVLEQSALAEAPALGAQTGPHAGPGSGHATIPCGTADMSQFDLWNTGPVPQLRNLALNCVHWTEITNSAWQADVVAAIKAAASAMSAAPCSAAAMTSAVAAIMNAPQQGGVKWNVSNYACQDGYSLVRIDVYQGMGLVAILRQQGSSWKPVYGPTEGLCIEPVDLQYCPNHKLPLPLAILQSLEAKISR